MTEAVFARLSPGSRFSWLRLLCEGWSFSDPTTPEPMMGSLGRYAVLMVREC